MTEQESNLIKHAKNEFYYAGWTDEHGNHKCSMQKLMCKGILDLLKVFSEQHHSGTTAPYAIDLFKRLASFESITPLSGEEKEWSESFDGGKTRQNKRVGHVFQDTKTGNAYDIDGKVFWHWELYDKGDPYKSTYTNINSRTPVTFPYTPKTEYVYNENWKDYEFAPPQTEAGIL